MANFKRIQFFKSHISRQNWSLPDSIIYYILKNPSTSKVYQKLIQSCKYFFIKNPILIINEKLYIAILSYLHYPKPIDLKNISSKLWIKNEINICSRNGDEGYRASSIVPKIFKCDARRLILMKQIILFKELLFLASNVQKIILDCTIVKNENGSILDFEKIIEFFPKLESFIYTFSSNSNITYKSAKELIKIPHFSNLKYFSLWEIPEIFDIDNFYTYVKKNKHTIISLAFCNTISDAYKTRLEEIIDEIIEAEVRDFKIPFIFFPGMNGEKRDKMFTISFRV